MNKSKVFSLLLLLLACSIVVVLLPQYPQPAAQSLESVVPEQAEVIYRKALPPYHYQFPKDHFSHPAFKTEWWYYTGHLFDKQGQPYGYELTFFRVGSGLKPKANVSSNWQLNNYILTHFALTDIPEKRFYYTEKFNRAVPFLAGASAQNYAVWNEGWRIDLEPKTGAHQLKAATNDYAIVLTLLSDKAAAIHGVNGVSQKASCKGCASHYYSQTRMKTSGTLWRGKQRIDVTGLSWMDHEFGSNQLSQNQTGWDWLSIQLNNNTELMLYVLRNKDGSVDENSSASLTDAKGKTTHLLLNQFKLTSDKTWESPKTKAIYPDRWHVSIPSRAIELTISPKFADQELVMKYGKGPLSYWEGACSVTGTIKQKPVDGHAYVELTGYQNSFNEKI